MKTMTRLAAALAVAAIALPATAKEFRSADVHPEDYPTVMAVKYMSDIISQKTGGKHSIKVYTGNALGGEKDTIEQTKIGALDFVRINVAPMNNICPATMVPTMPFLFRSKEHMRKVLDGPIGQEILKSCEKRSVGVQAVDDVVADIEAKLHDRAEKEITSLELGEIVMEHLQKLDQVAYVRFASVYRQFKDISQFMDEVKHLIKDDKPAKAVATKAPKATAKR